MIEREHGHNIDLLLVGLGGGALPMFINKRIPNVSFLLSTMCIVVHVHYVIIYF